MFSLTKEENRKEEIYSPFNDIIFQTDILKEANEKYDGIRDSDLIYLGSHNDIFELCIENNESPLSALKITAQKMKEDLLTRDAFLKIVSRDANFSEYTQLEGKYHKLIETQYIDTINYITTAHIIDIKPSKILTGWGAFKIIEDTIKKAVYFLKKNRAGDKFINDIEIYTFLSKVLTSWRVNFIKGHPNILYKAFSHLVELDKTQYENNETIIKNLYYSILQIPLMTELKDDRDKFIWAITKAFDGENLYKKKNNYIRTLCTAGSIMDKKTFKSHIKEKILHTMLDDIINNTDLTREL